MAVFLSLRAIIPVFMRIKCLAAVDKILFLRGFLEGVGWMHPELVTSFH